MLFSNHSDSAKEIQLERFVELSSTAVGYAEFWAELQFIFTKTGLFLSAVLEISQKLYGSTANVSLLAVVYKRYEIISQTACELALDSGCSQSFIDLARLTHSTGGWGNPGSAGAALGSLESPCNMRKMRPREGLWHTG